METTTQWFCDIGLDTKYGYVFQREGINGQALLLLAGKDLDQLVLVFQLKKGPKTILVKSLEPHLEAFDESKHQTASTSEKAFLAWTVEELCNWLSELGISEECLALVKAAEVNGEAFLLLQKQGKIREFLNLKVGSWVVLEHELFLHFGKMKTLKVTRVEECLQLKPAS